MCGTFEYGLNAAAKEFDGKNKYIRITDIDDTSREFLLSDLSSPDICLDGMSKYLLSSGDIVFARTGASVGKTYIYRENDGIVYFAGFLIRAKVNQDNDAEFVFQSTLSPSYEKYIRITSQRSGQPGVNAQEYGEYDLFAPSKEEQQRIGHFLRGIDSLITLHQRKYDKLQVLKKAMLEKMFPKNGSSVPEIRFKGFTDAWEQRKLGEIATFINGRAYSQPELLSSGKYKVLRVGNFYTNDSWYYSDLELGEKYYADYGDLLYTWSATFGPHIWLGDRVIYHYHIWKINLSDQLEKQFAVQLLEQDRTNILSSKNGSTMVHITKEGMEQKDVIIPPSTKEQQEIGAFFLQLDNLITLHQRELEKLQNIKKSMLEKMFV